MERKNIINIIDKALQINQIQYPMQMMKKQGLQEIRAMTIIQAIAHLSVFYVYLPICVFKNLLYIGVFYTFLCIEIIVTHY